MKRKKPTLTSDQLTYLNISMLATCIEEMLDQYNTAWMSPKLFRAYDAVFKAARNLEQVADKLAGVEVRE